MNRRFSACFVLAASLAAAFGCSAGGDGTTNDNNNGGSPSLPVGGSGPNVNVSGSDTGRDPNDMRELPVRQKTCDAQGQNCTCLRLALLGTLDSAANLKDTKPFMDWLNGNSEGTATLSTISTKPTLDAAFLANYDILLVANVNTWAFSADEKAAVQKWVRETGGGIISLTGFTSADTEIAASSQLIEFSGLKYQAPKTAENGQTKPVYYKGGTTDLKNCLAWNGGMAGAEAIITAPIKFTPQAGTLEKLTFGLDYVGAFIGWGVTAPAGATVVATDPVTGSNMAVAYEVDGKGRIFAFGDEWVIFANQWVPTGQPNNMQMDQYNPCWHPADATSATGFFHSVQTLYQTKQFWYDAINWVAPPNECNFIVKDPDVVVK